MKKVILFIFAVGLAAQQLNQYEQVIVRTQNRFVLVAIRADQRYDEAQKRFSDELNQWVVLKKNVVAAKGRDQKEKDQWKLVVQAWEELSQREKEWEDVRMAWREFQKAVENE